MLVKNIRKNSTSRDITVCHYVTLTAQTLGNFRMTCQATLTSYNCTRAPEAANALCGATKNTTTMTVTTTANGNSSSLNRTSSVELPFILEYFQLKQNLISDSSCCNNLIKQTISSYGRQQKGMRHI